MWKEIGKIVSEIALVLYTVIFNRLCAIALCIKKRFIKKSFSFRFSLVVVAVAAVF